MPNWTENYLYFVGEEEKAKKDYEAFKEVLVSRNMKEAKNQEYAIKSNDKGYFVDFNKLIPMPKCLDISENDFAVVYYLTERLAIPVKNLDTKTRNLLFNLVNNIFHEKKNHKHSWAEELIIRERDKIENASQEELDELYKHGETLVSNYKTYGHMFWYTWCCENWGTKWNAVDSTFNWNHHTDRDSIEVLDDEEPSVKFSTAWCFPKPILEELVRRVPNIELWWEIENEDIAGDPPLVIMVKDGRATVKQLLYPKANSKEFEEFFDEDLGGFNFWNYLDEALVEGYDWDNPKWQIVSL